MTTNEYRKSIEFLEEHTPRFPYACRTKVEWPDPDAVRRLTRLEFVHAPLVKEREWRFRTVEEMRRFKQNYTTLDNRL